MKLFLTVIMQRIVLQQSKGIPVSDGAGVKLTRILGTGQIGYVDPFLMLDEFKSENKEDYIEGFPPHPHRGFETVTYMKNGKFKHRDSYGGEGILSSGSVQWMTAGKGIIHSEMPIMEEGLLWGFQLWINLPSKHKLTTPKYEDVSSSEMPLMVNGTKKVKIISGNYQDKKGHQTTFFPVEYFDVQLGEKDWFIHKINPDWSCFIYVYQGKLLVHGEKSTTEIDSKYLVTLGDGDEIKVSSIDKESGFIFLAAPPIGEPVAWGGPFVMNTKEEVYQAYTDYQNGQFGMLKE